MKVRVLELEKKLFDGEADKVIVPATEGEMCLLPNHISIITSMKSGKLKIYRKGIERPVSIPINSGVCSFSDNCAVFIL